MSSYHPTFWNKYFLFIPELKQCFTGPDDTMSPFLGNEICEYLRMYLIIQESIIILGLVVRRLADAVELGVLLALPGACRRDHLLLLGLG